ncbi:MAG: hypothetical protein H6923_01285 [Alphaproteobacteria bacterium]|nr:hypothetical protein [Alphaproteobacteria bacterium]
MAKALRTASLVLFTGLCLFLLWFGWLYANVSDMLWFHAAAVPEAARGAVRSLYFALMTLIGGASFALGLLGLYVVAVPLRGGAPLAAPALSLAFVVAFGMAAVTAEKLAAATGSPTSWHIMGVLIGLALAALLCDLGSRRLERSAL